MNTNSDEISRLRQEAESTRRALKTKKEEAEELAHEVDELSKVYESIQVGNYIEPSLLAKYGIALDGSVTPLQRLAAKSKVGGIVAERTEALHRVESQVSNLEVSLAQLSICPRCSGSGVQARQHYEREDSRIQMGESVEECALCRGSGTLGLG